MNTWYDSTWYDSRVQTAWKKVCIRVFSSPYFSAFRLITERYSVSLRIQSECRKIRTRKTPNTDTLHANYRYEHILEAYLGPCQISLTLSWRRPLSYRNQSIDSESKSMDWFLYDKDLRHERVNETFFAKIVNAFFY